MPGKTAHAARIIGNEFHVITLLCAAILLIILLAARGILNKKLFLVLLCMLILFDLSYMNWGAIRYGDEGYQWAKKARGSLAQSLGSDKSIFRVGSSPNPMGPNFEMYLRYQTVAGYNPLYLHRYFEYIRKYNPSLLNPGNVSFFYTPNGETVLMDLLNVKYEISHINGTYALRKSHLPRAFFVRDHEVLKRSEILDNLIRPDFDPTRKILFEMEDSPAVGQSLGPSSAARSAESSAGILSYGPDEIVAAVYAPTAGYLFFSEIYYPGWKAYVDGRLAPLLRGNYISRVIGVPQGHHTVKLAFDPLTIKWGLGITSLTLLLIVTLSAFHFIVPTLWRCGSSRFSRKKNL